ncbi:MAG: hypothetical protein EBZ78_04825 [Verrucomicrobia bacterium]|nr:hypothetical protein [Verrucomicrobiota bacterium]
MTDKIYEWHTALSLNRRLRQLIPRTTLLRWIGEKKLKTYGHRGAAFAFDPADIERLELQETARRIRLAAEALPPRDPGQMSDDQLGDAYAAADSDRQSLLWLEISKRRERGGQATMRSIQDAMARRAGKLQPLIDVMAGTYWSAERKQTIPVKGKTK